MQNEFRPEKATRATESPALPVCVAGRSAAAASMIAIAPKLSNKLFADVNGLRMPAVSHYPFYGMSTTD